MKIRKNVTILIGAAILALALVALQTAAAGGNGIIATPLDVTMEFAQVTPSPTPSPTPDPSASPTPVPTVSPTPAPTISPTPTPYPEPEPVPSPTSTPRNRPQPIPSRTPPMSG